MQHPDAPRSAAIRLLIVGFALLAAAVAHAQVPQLINYQGRVVIGSTNFDGTGRFKFALVNSGGTVTYWRNAPDTTPADGVPDSAVSLAVAKGLYSVQLGDTAVANMAAVPASVFTNNDVRLRVWFDDGTNGEELLTPDQRITAAGYAITAAGLRLPSTNSATSDGVVTQSGHRFIHSYGISNFFAGRLAGNLSFNTTYAVHNVGVGFEVLKALTEGSYNAAVGSGTLLSNTSGSANTAVGYQALVDNTTGGINTAFGFGAMERNRDGVYNTAIGAAAMDSNTSGANNVALGFGALGGNTTGQNNLALGYNAGSSIATGFHNIAIGNSGTSTDSNTIRIGTTPTHHRAFVAGIRGVTTANNNAVPVVIDSSGQLGTVSSSARYKEEIEDLGETSARIQALRPVKFRYSKPYDNGEKPIQFGLIAEEVAAAFPELAVYNDEGQPETVKYQDLTPLLLNEVQKLRAEKDELKQEGVSLRHESAELRSRLEKLEAIVNTGTRQ